MCVVLSGRAVRGITITERFLSGPSDLLTEVFGSEAVSWLVSVGDSGQPLGPYSSSDSEESSNVVGSAVVSVVLDSVMFDISIMVLSVEDGVGVENTP